MINFLINYGSLRFFGMQQVVTQSYSLQPLKWQYFNFYDLVLIKGKCGQLPSMMIFKELFNYEILIDFLWGMIGL